MRVLCIHTPPKGTKTPKGRPSLIVEGDVYEVIDESENSYELSFHPDVWYGKGYFILTSDINELDYVNSQRNNKV